MSLQKIAVTIAPQALKEIDRIVRAGRFPNRSRVIQAALDQMLRRYKTDLLASECEKLNPDEERGLADESVGVDPWPRY